MEKTQKKGKWWTMKTVSGCLHMLTILLAIIFVFGFFGQLFESNFGAVKIEHLSTDIRGSQLSIILYYPRGASNQTNPKLPAVVFGHGGGCNAYQIKGIGAELARRGFVVALPTVYGSGLSEMPKYDEYGNGDTKGFSVRNTPLGMLDTVNFVKNLSFVDQTRIGLGGHSMGSTRTSAAVQKDVGYFTFNDIMINVLADKFGQKFTQDDISKDADSLAKARLNADQLTYYNSLRDQNKASYNTKIKAYLALGGGVIGQANNSSKVTVGGVSVTRAIQCNMAFMSGDYDNCWNVSTDKTVKAQWYQTNNLVAGTWYDINTNTASSKVAGTLFGTSVANDKALAAAVENRSLRMFYLSAHNTHSQETFSIGMSSAITKYYEQTLGYNNGYLSNPATVPLDANNNIWPWRSFCNAVTMFAMLAMIVTLAALLTKTKTFAPAVVAPSADIPRAQFNKLRYWITAAVTVALGFYAIYTVLGSSGLVTSIMFTPTDLWPITSISFMTACMLGIMTAGTIVIVGVNVFFNKKATGSLGLRALNYGIKFKNVMKCLAIALIMLFASYGSLSIVDYFFGQDMRVWLTAFSLMKADYWWVAFRYMVVFFPLYLIISAGINFCIRTDIPEWLDTLLCVVINSLGIWLVTAISWFTVRINGYSGSFFVNFFIAWQVNLGVPITAYLMRKMYKLTNSNWAGAAICSMIIAWTLLAGTGMGSAYIQQTWLGNFLNF